MSINLTLGGRKSFPVPTSLTGPRELTVIWGQGFRRVLGSCGLEEEEEESLKSTSAAEARFKCQLGEALAYICGSGAAGQHRVRLCVRHLRQFFFVFLLDGRGRGPQGAGCRDEAGS